jgi:hypothetical protein
MAQHAENPAVERLAAFIGEWSTQAEFEHVPPADTRGRVVIEWLAGKRFLIQRWEVLVAEAPDGIAIGADPKARATTSSTISTRTASPGSTR